MASQYRLAGWALEQIAEKLGVSIHKALDPLDPYDFITIVARLAAALRGATKGDEAAALKAALAALDVDWRSLSQIQTYRVYGAAKKALAEAAKAATKTEKVLGESTIVRASRAGAIRAFGLDIPTAVPNRGLTELLTRSTSMFIRDEFGRRSDAFDAAARKIVADGLGRGLRSADIAGELHEKLSERLVNRSREYWNSIANDFANKSRTASIIHSLDDAGIQKYMFSAVMDEVTCKRCGLLDGRTWSVAAVKNQLDYSLQLEDPEVIVNKRPFLRSRGDEVYFVKHGAEYIVARGGELVMSEEVMLEAGVTLPPVHTKCRCGIVSV